MNLENILLKLIRIGIILILLTPLIIGPFGINFSSYPKAVFFRSLVEIILVFYFLLIYFWPKKYLPKVSPLFLAISFFIFIIFLAGLFGVNFFRSFFGDLDRTEGVILHIHLFLFFLIVASIIKTKKDWLSIFKITIIVSAISSFIGILQKLDVPYFYYFYSLTGNYRAAGTLSNPDFFGPYLVMAVFLSLFVLMAEKNNILKLAWLAILIFNTYVLFLTQTRAALVGLVIGAAFFIIFWFFRYSNLKAKTKKAVLFLFLFFLIIIFSLVLFRGGSFWEKNDYLSRMVNISFSGRLPGWETAIRAWKDRPVLGWGPESFGYLFDKFYKVSYFEHVPEGRFFDRVHNVPLSFLVEAGILGLISYLLIFIIAFYLLFKRKSIAMLTLSAFFAAYFFQNLFIFDTISTYLLFFLVLGFIDFETGKKIPLSSNFQEEKKQEVNSDHPFFQQFVNIFTVLSFVSFILAAFYQINFKPTKTSLLVVEGTGYERTDIDKTLFYYKKALEQKGVFSQDIKIYVTERLLDIYGQAWAEKGAQDIIGIISNLKPFFEEKLETPDKIYRNFYKILFGIDEKLHLATSRDPSYIQSMERTLKRAIEFNDQRYEFYALLGRVKIYQGTYQQGEDLYKKSYQLTSQRLSDKFHYYKGLGASYLMADDLTKAADYFKKAIDVEYWLEKFKDEPLDHITNLIFIERTAFIYYQYLNDEQACEDIYKKAIEIFHPKYKKTLEYHLESLKKQRKI